MKSVILIGLLLFSSLVAAVPGGTIANGGQTVYCATPDKSVQSMESFDLYEGRVVYGYNYSPNVGNALVKAKTLAAKVDAAEATARGARADQRTIVDRADIIAKNMGLLYDYPLMPTHDSKEFYTILNGCRLIPTINFYNENFIQVNGDAWDRLLDVDKAALYLHEAIYWHLRQGGVEKDSRRTRKAVSYLMTGAPLESISALPKGISSPVQYCSGPGTKFWAYKNNQGLVTLQFIEIGGYLMLTRTTMTDGLTKSQSPMVIDPSMPFRQVASGRVNSILDTDMIVALEWGYGHAKLKADIHPKTSVSEEVRCQEMR